MGALGSHDRVSSRDVLSGSDLCSLTGDDRWSVSRPPRLDESRGPYVPGKGPPVPVTGWVWVRSGYEGAQTADSSGQGLETESPTRAGSKGVGSRPGFDGVYARYLMTRLLLFNDDGRCCSYLECRHSDYIPFWVSRGARR